MFFGAEVLYGSGGLRAFRGYGFVSLLCLAV